MTAEITIKIIKTDSGQIRVKFNNGPNILIKDELCNSALLASLEVELDLQNKPHK